ncbi:MAG: hypothetical protein EB829_01455 [Nitrosopumilus sp. H8]|nr:MAG: hypothetical protein EB830_02760 [Nitrosopumilus sp. H13]RNJ79737.1 MAG: hypothetical protein EB829_01455 [Nitrosopumilus sp. H8]
MVVNCRICHRVSASGDHLDCVQKRSIELEEDMEEIPEKMNLAGCEDLGVEIRAVLEHLAKS